MGVMDREGRDQSTQQRKTLNDFSSLFSRVCHLTVSDAAGSCSSNRLVVLRNDNFLTIKINRNSKLNLYL